MRRSWILPLLAVLLALPAKASAAVTIDAAEFAAKCSTGTYMLGFSVRITGTGTLTGDCFITLAEDVTLGFLHASFDDVGGGCCAMIVSDSLRDSRIVVKNSTIDLHGAVQLAAGCCSGGEVTHPEENGRVDARNSFIRGDSVELSGSTADDFGTVVVRSTYLEATNPSFLVRIRASVPAIGGTISVNRSHLVSAGDILVDTDVAGRTVVRNTILAAAGTTTITTGTGGSCVSSGNTPPSACT